MLFFVNSTNMLEIKQGELMDSYLLVISSYDPNYQYLYKLTNKFFEDYALEDLEDFVDSGSYEENEEYCISCSDEQPREIYGYLYTVIGDF